MDGVPVYDTLAAELAAMADAAWESDEAKKNQRRAVDDVVAVLRSAAAAGRKSVVHAPTLYTFVRLAHVTTGLRALGFRVAEETPQWSTLQISAARGIVDVEGFPQYLRIEW